MSGHGQTDQVLSPIRIIVRIQESDYTGFFHFSKIRVLQNACMDFDEILLVDRCRDVYEVINF